MMLYPIVARLQPPLLSSVNKRWSYGRLGEQTKMGGGEHFVQIPPFLAPKYFERQKSTIIRPKIFPKKLQKKRAGVFVQNSPILVPQYFQRQKNTILHSKKYFLQKMLTKKGGVFRTEFTINPTKFTYKITLPHSKICLGVEMLQ